MSTLWPSIATQKETDEGPLLKRAYFAVLNASQQYERKASTVTRSSFRKSFVHRREGHPRVLKGRCFVEPLLSRGMVHMQRARSESTSSRRTSVSNSEQKPRTRSKRSRSYSMTKSKSKTLVDPSQGFGEISFLKNKLGYTLPGVEDTLKSLHFVHEPRGRLNTLTVTLKRYSKGLYQTKLLYAPSKSSAAITSLRKKKKAIYKRGFDMPLYTNFPINVGRSADHMQKNRIKQMSQIEILAKSVEPAFQKVKNKKERAVLSLFDGSVVAYTKEELESFYHLDEQTLKAVKNRIAADRRKVALITQARRDKSLSKICTDPSQLSVTEYERYTHLKRNISLQLAHIFTM